MSIARLRRYAPDMDPDDLHTVLDCSDCYNNPAGKRQKTSESTFIDERLR